MTERLKGLQVDDALKPACMSAVVDQSQLEQDLRYIKIGRTKARALAWGGEILNRETPGFYLQPALFTETTNAMAHRARKSSARRLRYPRQELR